MTLVLIELFGYQVSGMMIPKLVKATYTYHQNYIILLNIV